MLLVIKHYRAFKLFILFSPLELHYGCICKPKKVKMLVKV